ncbi:hypothetical protein SDC9_132543 [bioreactor metagenome]|uniref:Uncharacterized protein n=1 Tax=bioreactor metagenome TaxID=1076179 RepID=A0A645DA21_9ZZZZ
MHAFAFSWEHRAALGIALVAHGHHVVESFPPVDVLICRFCILAFHGDADLSHGLDHQWIEISGFDATAVHIKAITGIVADECLTHLASGRIVDAYKHDSFLAHCDGLLLGCILSELLGNGRIDSTVHHFQNTVHDKDTVYLCSFTLHINDSGALEGREMLGSYRFVQAQSFCQFAHAPRSFMQCLYDGKSHWMA